VADAILASAGLRPRSLFLAPSATSIPPLRSTRFYRQPMAVPARATRSPWQVVIVALCLVVAVGVVGPMQMIGTARAALHGLGLDEAPPFELFDLADLPAMDPILAQVVDPRPMAMVALQARPRRGIQPFQYDLRPEDSLLDVAGRFGVPLPALLWNNQLDTPDGVQAGQRLTFLPLSGVLHQVRAGETVVEIAARYGARVSDLVEANDLEPPYILAGGQTLVVLGGTVPTPIPTMLPSVLPSPLPTLLALEQAIGQHVQAGDVAIVPAMATATARALHAALVGTAVALPRDDLPGPPRASAAEREFILSLATAARESQRIMGVPASVTLAQAILESDWGRSRLAREAKNLFGIKATTRPGTAGVYRTRAWEILGGATVFGPDAFKAYESYADSIVDHARWFHEQPRYASALEARHDPQEFARAITAAGYATDPAYANKLIALMDRFELYRYDGSE